MNFRKIEKELDRLLNRENDLGFAFEEKDGRLTAKCNLNFNLLDVEAYVAFTFFPSSMASYSVYFDNIDETEEVLELLNEFNKESLYFKAYADEFLILDHTVALLDECDVVDYTKKILSDLADDDFAKDLQPLVDLTYTE